MKREARSPARTFPVADVEPASGPLEESPYQEALESLLTAERPTKGIGYRPIEACSRRTSSLVAGIGYHPLVSALHLAYAEHHPIALSPDMIWLLICQAVVHHVHANAEELRPRFVQHPGRLTLEVERGKDDRYRKGSRDNPWPEVFADFSAQVRAHIGPAYGLFVPSFSTTGPAERAAAEITMLDSIQNYHHYLLGTVNSGIPAITLEGTFADWQDIVERVEGFGDLGLDWWIGPLRPVLQQFAFAAAGEVDAEFWNRMYRSQKPGGAGGADSASGWIALFFPYLTNDEGKATQLNPWLAGHRKFGEPFEDEQVPRRRVFSEGKFPGGLATAPITWVERDTDGRLLHRKDTQLLGGFVGVAQAPATLSLRPEIGWAVREQSRR